MTKNEIVVGIDGSPSARAALHWAAEEAKRSGSTLRAVYVHDPTIEPVAHGRPFVLEDLVFTPEGELPVVERTTMTALFAEVSPRTNWQLDFVKGVTGPVLVKEAEHSRLLVIGTHEHVGLGRVLNGSVSHFCLSHACCPVVAVPPPAAGSHPTNRPISSGVSS